MAASAHVHAPLSITPRISAADFTSDLDLTRDELASLLSLTAQVKHNRGRYSRALNGRYLSLLFEKPSLRTRITFELAIKQLGGDAVLSNGPIGDREPLQDVARNLDRWTNCIVARTFSHDTIEELAAWSSVPVINALSDLYHPCQALADMFTLREHFGADLRGRKLAFVGDGNNVAHSLMICAAQLGLDFSLAHPQGHGPNTGIAACAQDLAASTGAALIVTTDPYEALAGADAVYTDVWTSMGQEGEREKRVHDFADYQVNPALMAKARPGARFMHCLPAKRGEEVTTNVFESPQSMVFDQAENRLHVQKALLLMLLS
ncbi:MAG: ornithine carbamoyltransferase [Bryobacteraceae bacterium]